MKQGFAKSAPRLYARQIAVGVGSFGVGGQIVDVPVSAAGEDHRVGDVHAEFARNQVAGNDAARLPTDDDEVEHFRAGNHGDVSGVNLAFERLECAKKKLLTRLTTRVKSARHLSAAKGTIRQRATVLACKGNALRHALIDDVHADLRQPVYVTLASAEVPALDCAVKKAVNAIAVVRVILRRIDSPLRGDGMRAAWRILKTETFHSIAQLTERRGCGCPGETGSNDNYGMLALVGGVTSFMSKRAASQACSIGPRGIFASSVILRSPTKCQSEWKCTPER